MGYSKLWSVQVQQRWLWREPKQEVWVYQKWAKTPCRDTVLPLGAWFKGTKRTENDDTRGSCHLNGYTERPTLLYISIQGDWINLLCPWHFRTSYVGRTNPRHQTAGDLHASGSVNWCTYKGPMEEIWWCQYWYQPWLLGNWVDGCAWEAWVVWKESNQELLVAGSLLLVAGGFVAIFYC